MYDIWSLLIEVFFYGLYLIFGLCWSEKISPPQNIHRYSNNINIKPDFSYEGFSIYLVNFNPNLMIRVSQNPGGGGGVGFRSVLFLKLRYFLVIFLHFHTSTKMWRGIVITYVCLYVCLSVCLSVDKITGEPIIRFWWTLVKLCIIKIRRSSLKIGNVPLK